MIFQHINRVFQGKIFPSIYNLSIICRYRGFLRVSTLTLATGSPMCVYFTRHQRQEYA